MAPNPKCIVCSDKPQVFVKIDTTSVTVKQFRDEVLVKSLNMIQPDVITENKGLVLISSEEGETDCNDDKKLSELDVVDGCILKVDDFVQQYELTVIIQHKEPTRDGDLFEIIADPDALKPESEKAAEPVPEEQEPKTKKFRAETPADDDDDLCIIEDADDGAAPAAGSSSASFQGPSEKKAVVIVLDEPMDQGPGTSSESRNKRPRRESDDDVCIIDDD